MRADPEQVSLFLSSLSPLTAQEVVTNSAANLGSSGLSQYGLDSPAVEIDLTHKGGPDQRLLVGDDPRGQRVLRDRGRDARIFTTSSSAKSTFGKTANNLRDKRLITLNTDQMNRIEFVRNGSTIALTAPPAGGRCRNPRPIAPIRWPPMVWPQPSPMPRCNPHSRLKKKPRPTLRWPRLSPP